MSAAYVMSEWFEEVWNKGNASHIDAHLAQVCDVVGLTPDPMCSPAEFHEFHKTINQGFSDLKCTVVRSVEDGEDVAGVVNVTAVHRATGTPVNFDTSYVGTVRDGKICEIRNTVNFLDVLIQVQAVPSDILERSLA